MTQIKPFTYKNRILYIESETRERRVLVSQSQTIVHLDQFADKNIYGIFTNSLLPVLLVL